MNKWNEKYRLKLLTENEPALQAFLDTFLDISNSNFGFWNNI